MSRLILNSKLFRKYLKNIVADRPLDVDSDYKFIVEGGNLTVGHHTIAVEARGAREYFISPESVTGFIKVLKGFKEQPICLKMEPSDSYFTLTCAVI